MYELKKVPGIIYHKQNLLAIGDCILDVGMRSGNAGSRHLQEYVQVGVLSSLTGHLLERIAKVLKL